MMIPSRALHKALGAILARIGFLSSVNSLVSLRNSKSQESCTLHPATDPFYSQLYLHVGLLNKGLPAILTGMFLVSKVDGFVPAIEDVPASVTLRP